MLKKRKLCQNHAQELLNGLYGIFFSADWNILMESFELNFGVNSGRDSAAERMPLAARMRPRTLDEYCGQSHILASGKLLRRAIDADNFSSIILSGPPGVGKTSLAELIALSTDAAFIRLSGVTSTVADIRREITMAKERRANSGRKTILFVDEIHRFNRAQQDSLLPDVESGSSIPILILILS